MKNLIFFISISIFVISCNKLKTNKINEASVDFVLNDCEATYKGKPLPMGKPIEEWIKILGKPSRVLMKGMFIWDDLGVVVEEYGRNNETDPKGIHFLFIFFSNLDSESGQKGKLRFARDRESAKYLIDGYLNSKYKDNLTEELKNEFINDRKLGERFGIDKYIYPYKTYDKPVSINGAYVVKGMSLKEINKERSAKDLQKFTLADFNMNMINEQWQTKGDEGEYWEDEKIRECPNQNYVLFNSVRYSDYELEFIRVSLHADDNHTPPIYYN